jgi:1-acyl-sn-glycerol-3-phosphate acyltransferase
MIHRFFYILLRSYVKLAFRIYFRRWQVFHQNKEAEKGSIIFSSNHQNAFIDP